MSCNQFLREDLLAQLKQIESESADQIAHEDLAAKDLEIIE